MASRAVRDWYEALRSLERKAAESRPRYSRRGTAEELKKKGVKLHAQRLSEWLRDDIDAADIPRRSDPEIETAVWALIELWSDWAGDRPPNRRYWMDLLDAAQPAGTRLAAAETRAQTAAQARPAQLPVVPADFVGRDRELAELRALCAPEGPGPVTVVVHGVAGVGKSALASYAARELAPGYPDGQLFSRLREDEGPLQSGSVLARFLRALNVPAADVPDDVPSQAALYRTLLAGRRILVVLDDAASEAQVRPLLPPTQSCLLLVTSRNPLPALEGATPYRLELLGEDESVGLLAHIAGKDRVDSKATGREVVELCGRLPLAIRIAAARLRARTDWTAAHLAERLANTRRRLRELRVGDLDVRAAFELSYRGLGEDAARLFRLLAVRPGPTFSAEFAAALLDCPVPDAEELLERLILDQLIEVLGTPGRYWMHDLIWLFALDLLVERGEVQLPMDAMLPWYLYGITQVICALRLPVIAPSRFDDALVPAVSEAEALAWLDGEEENLFGLLNLIDGGNDEVTVETTILIMTIARRYGMPVEGERALSMGLAAARRTGNHAVQAGLLLVQGEYLVRRRDWEQARERLTEALELVDQGEDSSLAGALHLQLGYVYQGLGRDEDAAREMTAAAELAAIVDPKAAKILSACLMANSLLDYGQHEAVIALLEPNMQHIDAEGGEDEGLIRLYLGMAYNRQGRHAEAVSLLKRSLRLCHEHGIRIREPQVLLELGIAYRDRGWLAKAREAWTEGLSKAETAPGPRTVAGLAHELAEYQYWKGNHEAAGELFTRAAEAYGEAGQDCDKARALDRLAHARAQLGDRDGAVEAWDLAVPLVQQFCDKKTAEYALRLIRDARARYLS
ncbi:NB-ARC domain-containing protein [Actinomadura mexicana]|uniref:ATP-, maltotriose- and DNA-dependent transcriptional regulator MalT n=1 Tax=Actinomadura mexicana TaxID=134959 RepID=A0A239GYC4_9ACTN|nr:NB-ARC domain-containing protein [Actinomadura mexicana]SNS73044.1 ATP-, maltotriose- and DNA-dependent transcriptional regulator MalT [Actinomadura mexicana]